MHRVLRSITIIAAALIITLIASVCYMRNDSDLPERQYIAHAGGNIEGYPYTNSLEAVNNAIEKGITHIELDFSLSSDSILVAVHKWAEFREMAGLEINNEPLAYADFMDARLYGNLHPLSASMVDSIFLANPSLTLVTDKTDNLNLLSESMPNLNGRMIVECFSPEAYDNVNKSDFARPMWSFNRRNINHNPWKLGNFYVMDISSYNNLHGTLPYEILTRILNYPIAVYIVHIPEEWNNTKISYQLADSLMDADPFIRYVYIDDL